MRAVIGWLSQPNRVQFMRSFARLVIIPPLLVVAALVALLLLWPPPEERQSVIASPGSTWAAVTYRINGQGALGGFNYEVRLTKWRERHKRGSELWSSYMEEPSRVRWVDPSHVEITVTDDREGVCSERQIVQGKTHGISSTTLIAVGGRLQPFDPRKP